MGRFLTFIFLAIVALGGGFYFYQRNILAVPITATDLDRGGSFSLDERATLKTACAARVKNDSEKVCSCIVDKAATDLSRFDLMVVTASFQERLSDVVGLTKGLVQSGIPIEKVKAAEDGSKARMKDMLKTCDAE